MAAACRWRLTDRERRLFRNLLSTTVIIGGDFYASAVSIAGSGPDPAGGTGPRGFQRLVKPRRAGVQERPISGCGCGVSEGGGYGFHLDVIIGKEGRVANITVNGGHPLLISAALEAVRQWVYQPSLLNGIPVEVATQVDVYFSLPYNCVRAVTIMVKRFPVLLT